MDLWEAQYSFWSGFGVPAYEENSVPSGSVRPSLPYITYQSVAGPFDSTSSVTASVWTRDTSWETADGIADLVFDRLGGRNGGGYVVPCEDGGLWFTADDSFAQNMGDPTDDAIRRKVLQVSIHFL